MSQHLLKHLVGKLAFLCFTTALALGLAPEGGPGAEAQTTSFTVNSTTDATDANPGDGVCETAAGNDVCTLRAAIQETNALAGADTVLLPSGIYRLTIAGVLEDLAEFGDLDITDDLTITGAGEDSTIIDGNALDRVLHIVGDVTVEMAGVTIQNGNTVLASEDGGGIYNEGTLTLHDSTVSGNDAKGNGGGIYSSGTLTLENSTVNDSGATGDGGGIYSSRALTLNSSTVSNNTGGGIYISGNATLNNSTVSNNFSRGHGGGIRTSGTTVLNNSIVDRNTASPPEGLGETGGGGIYNWGRLVLSNSAVTGNTASLHGGGIYNVGTLALSNTTVSSNVAERARGGGIYNQGRLILNNSTVSDNRSGSWGGGIHNIDGELTLINSTISDNSANTEGGGIDNRAALSVTNSTVSDNSAEGNGGGIRNSGTVTLNKSTVASNSARGRLAAYPAPVRAGNGGGIDNRATLSVTNSTVSGNGAKGSGGGIYHGPDASSTLNLSNVTITNNTADSEGDRSGTGGGIFNQVGLVNVRNTIIAGNHGGSPATQHRDCSTSRPLDSYGYNLIEDTTGCPISGDATSNLTGISPGLGPLQDNGGSTFTHALLPDSPAIDAGNPAGCTDHAGTALISDQRGFQRTVDGNNDGTAICDIGAHEAGDLPTVSFYLPLITTGSRPVAPITPWATLQEQPTPRQVAATSGILGVGLFLGFLLLGIIVTRQEEKKARRERPAGTPVEKR